MDDLGLVVSKYFAFLRPFDVPGAERPAIDVYIIGRKEEEGIFRQFGKVFAAASEKEIEWLRAQKAYKERFPERSSY